MKKKFLKIIGVMVLFIALIGFWGYTKYFKPDPGIQQQLNNQFGAEFFNSFDDKKGVNNSGAVNNVKSGDGLDRTKEQEEGKNVTTSTPVNENSGAKQITQDDINNKYKTQFNSLQSVAMSRLDTLYSAAIQEYVQSSKAGTLNRSGLAQKYIQAGNTLEANLDNQVYTTLNAMQAELMANNLPTDSVSSYKREYEKAKSDKRSQLLAKVSK